MNDTTLPPGDAAAVKSGGDGKPNPRARRRGNGGSVRRGFGLHDWVTLTRRAKDLAQRKGAPLRREIPMKEVELHNKPYDGWMVLRGKVYNVGPYLAYHPGGSGILEKCLGKDATKLFDKYHSWVNIENLVGCLLLGYLETKKMSGIEEGEGGYLEGAAAMGAASDSGIVVPPAHVASAGTNASDPGFAMPKPRPPRGQPVASLLPPGDDDDAKGEDDALQFG